MTQRIEENKTLKSLNKVEIFKQNSLYLGGIEVSFKTK